MDFYKCISSIVEEIHLQESVARTFIFSNIFYSWNLSPGIILRGARFLPQATRWIVQTYTIFAHLEYRQIFLDEWSSRFLTRHFVILLELLVFCSLFRVLFGLLLLLLIAWFDFLPVTKCSRRRPPTQDHIAISFICLRNPNLTGISLAFSHDLNICLSVFLQ